MLRNKGTKFGAYIRRRHYTGVDCMMHVAHDDNSAAIYEAVRPVVAAENRMSPQPGPR